MSFNIQNPLNPEQQDLFAKLLATLNKEQTIWISGYMAGIGAQTPLGENLSTAAAASAEPTTLTILYGSRTGHGEALAKQAQELAVEHGLHVHLKNMKDYKPKDIANEKKLLVIVSTHGSGVPAFNAQDLHEFLHSKRAPNLANLNYAVLALGDTKYTYFCKAGIEFDEQLAALGAKRIVPRIECDVDYEETAPVWIANTIKVLNAQKPTETAKPQFSFVAPAKEQNTFSKKNPYSAAVLDKVYLHGRGSDRQTVHIELEVPETLAYEPGDAAGIIPVNPAELIQELLKATGLESETEIEFKGKKMSAYEVLHRELELSKITVDVVKRYLELHPNKDLQVIFDNAEKFKSYVAGRDIVDLFLDYPSKIKAEDLTKILKPLQPRYYSISSSSKANPGELHLTVGVVNYEQNGRKKYGACSTYLSEVTVDDEHVPIFIEKNPNFRLPDDEETPIIMIGAGTGIAPYRSFIQERDASEKKGKSWLFFGNRNFETEFLYQTEWQQFLKTGTLTNISLAFSRDQDKPVYVQHRLEENAEEIYKWLEDGAYLYICGDMKKMAVDVQNTLVNIVAKQGFLTQESAQEYVDNLQKERRLQLDVY